MNRQQFKEYLAQFVRDVISETSSTLFLCWHMYQKGDREGYKRGIKIGRKQGYKKGYQNAAYLNPVEKGKV